MQNSDSQRIELGSNQIPEVLLTLAELLPGFEGANLECQLQTFDIFLALLSTTARPEIAAILRCAASKASNTETRQRIESAAQQALPSGTHRKESIELGSDQIPGVLFNLAEVLPGFECEDLEDQLQTFDTFLAVLSPAVRPQIAAMLLTAAAKSLNPETRQRIERAAQQIDSSLPPSIPRKATSAPDAATSKLISESEYYEAIRSAQATKDPAYSKPGDIGVIEVWVAPNGRIVAWLNVRYIKGEEDHDYFINNQASMGQ